MPIATFGKGGTALLANAATATKKQPTVRPEN
jgi:hypothetical protein